jgi:tetratricopeptide (TPR) repeat protein
LHGKSLYLAAANTLEPGADTAGIMNETRDNSLHLRTIIEFARLIEANLQTGLRFKWKYYADDDHISVPLIAEYDAFRFIFNFYRISYQTEQDSLNLDKLKEHYSEVSKAMGYTILPPERKINFAGYGFLRRKEFDKALACFTFNVENYPESFNVYDSMGDYYIATGNDAEAIKYFTKALSILEYLPTREKLEELTGK